MQHGARLQAAIDVLTEVLERGRPASLALADWGKAHRFAGSGDRGAIGNLVYDALRKRQSLAFKMQTDAPRAAVLAALRYEWQTSVDALDALCDGIGFSPHSLTSDERRGLEGGFDGNNPPPWVCGDYPEWLHSSFVEAFGDDAAKEGAALAERAPVDLRVNTLKATREKVLHAFAKHGATPTPYAPHGVRLPPRRGPDRSPNVEADPAHGRGWFEVQDEASQIAAALAGIEPRMQVLDLCAGAGGKTLSFAATMQNTGQIYAYDQDPHRFRPIFERLKRGGARCVQTLQPGDKGALDGLKDRMDVVLVDAPCTGTGVWRRKPDSKWRLTPVQLEHRQNTQAELLHDAQHLVKPGGRLVYVTCSILREENQDQITAFVASAPNFRVTPGAVHNLSMSLQSRSKDEPGVLLTPSRHGTDGFFICVLQRDG